MEALEQVKDRLQDLKSQLQPYCDELRLYLQQATPVQLYIAIAVLVFTVLLLSFTRLFRRSKSNTIVLAGLSGSGKTVIFYQLRDGSAHQGTVTSMDPNEGTFVLHTETEKKGKIKPVHVVDVPGHSRLRPKLDEFLPQAAGVVFVVDGLEFLPNCRAASEYLYDILTKSSIVKKRVPVFIFCNKMDKASAHSKEFIRKQLEKEIEKLRASRTAVSDADLTSEITLGIPGQPFAFSQCQNPVTVGEGSGLNGELYQLEQFLRTQVKP
uniref:Signal recognition particle receptor subunit beta n=1 Tax=Kalanchoe fedtschenkoi TaxID=63787 RepID=A0A7N0VF05_KALFE